MRARKRKDGTNTWRRLLAVVGLTVSLAHGQGGRPEPRIGYVYPAGASRGTTIEVLAGGQALKGVKQVRVSGGGVTARVIKTYRPVRNLNGEQRQLLEWRIACRRAEINHRKKPRAPEVPEGPDGKPAKQFQLPEMPFLDVLDHLDPEGIEHWMTLMKRKDRKQQNNQLGELVRIELKVADDAPIGMREVRFGGPQGFTNPVRFEISGLAERHEVEPNEPDARGRGEQAAAVRPPCVFNGQIQAGDVDVFRFRARRGERLVVRGEARSLIPYLADAVPGWFQMVATLRDEAGHEIAYGDDYRFDPDPAFCFHVPEDGEYTLEIRDSIYRGREDFVYRVHVGALPFITSMFPLGGTAGEPAVAEIRGWNLPTGRMRLDTSPEGAPIRRRRIHDKHGASNEVPYAVDELPGTFETEPNADSDHAQTVGFPQVIDGRIGKPGDVDVFRIEGKAGMELVIEVLARRLRSPLDAVLHVADERGRILAWNDDLMEKDGHLHLGDGLLTHHADPRVRVKLAADGPVFIRVADTQSHGGPAHAYRLRICGIRPDFDLRVTPSVVNAAAGAHVPVHVRAMRSDGFDGEILLSLENAPPGFTLSGARIPPGQDEVRVTLRVPWNKAAGIWTPVLRGTAASDGCHVTRNALPADDTMQAFLWRHLQPANEWLVCASNGRGKQPALELATEPPLRISSGASAELRVRAQKWIFDRGLEPTLSEPPAGITVSGMRRLPDGFAFTVNADASATAGMKTNLIIHLSAGGKPGASGKRNQRSFFATLPALPIAIDPPITP